MEQRTERKLLGLLGLLVGGLAAAAAVAQEPIDRTVAADPEAAILISNVAGSVIVSGWDRDEVDIQGTLGLGAERLDVEERRGRIFIEVVLPKGRHRDVKGTDLQIHVPAGCALSVETVSARIEVEGVSGSLDLESVSGGILARGRVEEAELESVSGDLDCFLQTERLQLSSVSGEIEVQGAGGLLAAETVSGSINIDGADFARLRCESVSGDVLFAGGLAEDGEFEINSHSGEIVLMLPARVDADFQVSTFSGDIDSDFGGRAERTGKYTPGRELNFTAGEGSATVRIETFSGDVTIRKK